MTKRAWQRICLAGSAITMMAAAPGAFATNGAYFTGNGPFSSGMGGAAIAFPQDVGSAVDNPAGMALLGSRVDVYGVVLPVSANSTFGSPDNHLFSRNITIAPGGGFNYQISPKWTFGMAITGAGAASNYGVPVLPIHGAGVAKASLMLVNTNPTITYKPLPNLSIGASLVLGFQQLRLNGALAPTANGSLQPVSSHGNSNAVGIGAGLGFLWTPVPQLTVGASYFTKTSFTPLSGYKDDLLAPSRGHIDSPSRYGIGIAIHPTPKLTLALDYLRIEWSHAPGWNSPDSWNYHSQNVGRIGISYDVNNRWTVRAGYSFANKNVDSNHTLANMYGPGISPRAVTLGATYVIDKNNLLTGAFAYNIPTTITGTGPSAGTNIRATYQEYTFGYTHRF